MNEQKCAHSEKASKKEQYPLTRTTETRQFQGINQNTQPNGKYVCTHTHTHTHKKRKNILLHYEETCPGRLNNSVKLKGAFMPMNNNDSIKDMEPFQVN